MARLRRNASVSRLAHDGEHAARGVLALSLGVGAVLSVVVPPDIPGEGGEKR